MYKAVILISLLPQVFAKKTIAKNIAGGRFGSSSKHIEYPSQHLIVFVEKLSEYFMQYP